MNVDRVAMAVRILKLQGTVCQLSRVELVLEKDYTIHELLFYIWSPRELPRC
jgi:hypothetical protein